MTETGQALVLQGVGKRYETAGGASDVLKDISLAVSPGETLAVVGPSGSGKSTLLNIIGSLDKPTSGSVMLGSTDIVGLAGRALADFRAGRVGFVFQDHHLLPQLTAVENVVLPSLAARDHDACPRAGELLERMGVAHRAEAFPAKMSGGERQRVAIARALINGPGLLLCDEPTGNLDRDTAAGVVALFLELARDSGVTVIMVTHNLELAGRFSRCAELRSGMLSEIEQADPGENA
ncbi:MAG: ABC transporter ATP-binding protein [Planctomycetes bacterium]|nr:ABC transporter ATP-binding protein [Planctomycetota bacterium]